MDAFVGGLLDENDLHTQDADLMEANSREVWSLEQHNLWRRVEGETLPPEANVLGDGFIYSLRNVGTQGRRQK